jgi:hypothetical protein
MIILKLAGSTNEARGLNLVFVVTLLSGRNAFGKYIVAPLMIQHVFDTDSAIFK